jgi:hypothetical protein
MKIEKISVLIKENRLQLSNMKNKNKPEYRNQLLHSMNTFDSKICHKNSKMIINPIFISYHFKQNLKNQEKNNGKN